MSTSKKLGRIPDGGGWRASGRNTVTRPKRVGYDYVHSAVDDHTRLAYSGILSDEPGETCAVFMLRAAAWFQDQGIDRISEVMTDNHWSYTHSRAFAKTLEIADAEHITIRPHCPWQNGKVERYNRTLQVEWAYRQVFTSNQQRADAPRLAPVLQQGAQTQLPRRQTTN